MTRPPEPCKTCGKHYRQKPGLEPVIELGRDSYQHKVYGKTYFPVLKLVDWVREPDGEEAPPAVATTAPAPVPAPAPEPEKPKRTRF